MEHDLFKEVLRAARRDVMAASRREEAINDIRHAASSLRARCFAPELTIDGSIIVMRLDLGVAPGGGAPADAAPAPAGKALPGPPTAQEKPPAPAGNKSGPLSDAERDQIVSMTVAGKSVKEISHALRRNCASVGRARGYLKERIEDARDLARLSQSDAPDTETPPTPAEGAPTPGAVAEGTSEGGDHTPALAPEPKPKPEQEQEPEPEPRPVGAFRSFIKVPPSFSSREAHINGHLNGLGYLGGWDPEHDLELVTSIISGQSKKLGAEILDKVTGGRAACLARWRLLNQNLGDLDHQAALARVLKYRATEGQK